MTCVLATTASVCQIKTECMSDKSLSACVFCSRFALALALALVPPLAISMLLLARARYLSVEYLINFFDILCALISKSSFTYSSRL